MEIVGSYRRGSKSSGDIDVILTHKDNKQHIFVKFLNIVKDNKIIKEFLSRGTNKSFTIAKIDEDDTHRRIDFLYCSPEEYPFSILYFTGSKAFNTAMRFSANKNNYSLNEHGMYKIDKDKKTEKVEKIFKDEKEIFDFLNLEYKLPSERIDNSSIVKIEISDTSDQTKYSPKTSIMEKMKKNMKKCTSDDCNMMTASSTSSIYQPNQLEEIKDEKTITLPSTMYVGKDNILKNIITKLDKEKASVTIMNSKKRNYKKLVELFKNDGIESLKTFNELELEHLIKKLNDLYYNSEPIVTDNEYDIIKEYVTEKYPDNKVVDEIGAPVKKHKAKTTILYGIYG